MSKEDNVVRDAGNNPEKFWDALDGDEMLPAEQRLWDILGWNEACWDGDDPEPASDDLDFDELSEQERMAAMALGFRNAKLWG
jgi:hypothetical protein